VIDAGERFILFSKTQKSLAADADSRRSN